jgi:hypothetical protein
VRRIAGAGVEAGIVSLDDMSSTRVNAVYRFECVSGSDLVDGVALAICPSFGQVCDQPPAKVLVAVAAPK